MDITHSGLADLEHLRDFRLRNFSAKRSYDGDSIFGKNRHTVSFAARLGSVNKLVRLIFFCRRPNEMSRVYASQMSHSAQVRRVVISTRRRSIYKLANFAMNCDLTTIFPHKWTSAIPLAIRPKQTFILVV